MTSQICFIKSGWKRLSIYKVCILHVSFMHNEGIIYVHEIYKVVGDKKYVYSVSGNMYFVCVFLLD